MLLEYELLTTLEREAAFALAAELLRPLGLRPKGICLRCGLELANPLLPAPATCPSCNRTVHQVFANGITQPSRFRPATEHPMLVTLEHDRGLVTVAATIEPWSLPREEHEAILRFIAKGLEAVLARDKTLESALARWDEVRVAAVAAQKAEMDERKRLVGITLAVGSVGWLGYLVLRWLV